jgi:hypothetical protein
MGEHSIFERKVRAVTIEVDFERLARVQDDKPPSVLSAERYL